MNSEDAFGTLLGINSIVAYVSRHGSTVSITKRRVADVDPATGWVKLDGNTQCNCNPKNLIRIPY